MKQKGEFVISKTAKGYYNYRLKSSNKETIAVSGGTGYSSSTSCKAGIESVRANAKSPIEDLTLRKVTELPNPKYQIYQDKADEYRFRLYARNGELLAVCEDGYSTKDACKKGILSLAKWAKTAEVTKEGK